MLIILSINIDVPKEFSSSKNKSEKKRREKSNNSTYKQKLKVDKNFGKFEFIFLEVIFSKISTRDEAIFTQYIL